MKEWAYTSYAYIFPYSFAAVFWLLNLIFGHNGNWLDHLDLFLDDIMMFAPIGAAIATLNASKNYGTTAEVAAGTDWVYTVDTDTKYS